MRIISVNQSLPNSRKMNVNTESHELPEYLKSSPNQKDDTKEFNLKNSTIHKIQQNKEETQSRNFTFNIGNSYEAPTYFISKNSVMDKKSYSNPYVENSDKWPLLSKINNKLKNFSEIKFNNQTEPSQYQERSKTIFK